MSRPTTELTHLFRQLKAPAAARALPKLADRARAEEWSYRGAMICTPWNEHLVDPNGARNRRITNDDPRFLETLEESLA